MSKKIKTKKNTNKTRNVINMDRDSVSFNELNFYVNNMLYSDTTIRTICDYMDMVGIEYDKEISNTANINSEVSIHTLCAFLTYTAAETDSVLKDLSEDDRNVIYEIIEGASDAIQEIAELADFESEYENIVASKDLRFGAKTFQSIVTAFRNINTVITASGVKVMLPKIYLEMFEVLGIMLYNASDNIYKLKDILINNDRHEDIIKNKIKEKFNIDLNTPIEFTLGDIIRQADLIFYNILKADNEPSVLDKIERLTDKSEFINILSALGRHYADIVNESLNMAVSCGLLESNKADLLVGECSESGMYELLKTAAPEVLDLKLRKVLWFTDITEEDPQSGLLGSTMIYMDENWVNVDNEFYNKLSAIGDLLKSIALLDDKDMAALEYCNTFIDLWGFETEEPEMAN